MSWIEASVANLDTADDSLRGPWRRLVFAAPLVMALILSLFQLSFTAALTEDAVRFIDVARRLGSPIREGTVFPGRGAATRVALEWLVGHVPQLGRIAAEEQHPGCSLLIVGMHATVGRWLATETALQWARAGQVGSLLAGFALILATGLLARRLHGPSAALTTMVLLAVVPAWIASRTAPLSDAAATALLAVSALFAVRLLQTGQRRDAFVCGLSAGVGYLFRPEAVQVAAVLGMVLLARGLLNRERRWHSVQHALCVGLPLLALAAPYMFLRGSVFTKVARVLDGESLTRAVSCNECAESWLLGDEAELARKSWLFQTLTPILPRPALVLGAGCRRLMACCWQDLGGWPSLVILLGLLTTRGRWQEPGMRLIGVVILLNVLLLPAALYYKKGYLDPRHALPLAALSSCWFWPGLLQLAAWCMRGMTWFKNQVSIAWTYQLAALGLLAVSVQGVTALERPLVGGHVGYPRAGAWLNDHIPAEAEIFDPAGLALFFAGREDEASWARHGLPSCLPELDVMLGEIGPVVHLVLTERHARRLHLDVQRGTEAHSFRVVACFPDADPPRNCLMIMRAEARGDANGR